MPRCGFYFYFAGEEEGLHHVVLKRLSRRAYFESKLKNTIRWGDMKFKVMGGIFRAEEDFKGIAFQKCHVVQRIS